VRIRFGIIIPLRWDIVARAQSDRNPRAITRGLQAAAHGMF
jgi:hypothetical protein